MKRRILTFITVFGMSCLVACGGEIKEDVSTDNKQESIIENVTNETTAKPAVETTETPVVEATPETTEEPVLYPGIDMESDLPGEEWVETFIGIIEEPKIVVFSDETGRKDIFENDSVISFNPDNDMLGVYLPNRL